jgi:hypothetical protein
MFRSSEMGFTVDKHRPLHGHSFLFVGCFCQWRIRHRWLVVIVAVKVAVASTDVSFGLRVPSFVPFFRFSPFGLLYFFLISLLTMRILPLFPFSPSGPLSSFLKGVGV